VAGRYDARPSCPASETFRLGQHSRIVGRRVSRGPGLAGTVVNPLNVPCQLLPGLLITTAGCCTGYPRARSCGPGLLDTELLEVLMNSIDQ